MTHPTKTSYANFHSDPAIVEARRALYFKELAELGIPFGTCFCKCLGKTNIAPSNNAKDRWVKGMPIRYICGHNPRSSPLDYVEEDRGYKTPCWVWQRVTRGGGYGRMHNGKGKAEQAHRVYYERRFGAIPAELDLDHLCRVRRCINPEHMEPVTRKVNIRRGCRTKVTREMLLAIRELTASGLSSRKVGAKVGLSNCHVSRILRGERWADID